MCLLEASNLQKDLPGLNTFNKLAYCTFVYFRNALYFWGEIAALL